LTEEVEKNFVEKYKKMGFNIGEKTPNTHPNPQKRKSPKPNSEGKIPYHTEINTEPIDQRNGLVVFCGKTSGNLLGLDLDHEELYGYFKHYSTFTTRTGRGYHIFFRTFDTPKSKSMTNEKGQHIDFLGQGKIAVLPPSIHPETKKPYEIVQDLPVMQLSRKHQEELIQLIQSLGFGDIGNKTKSPLPLEDIKQSKVPKGLRHNCCRWYANHLLSIEECDEKTIWDKMTKWNEALPVPMPQEEFEELIEDCIEFISENKTPQKEKKEEIERVVGILLSEYNFKTFRDNWDMLVYEDGVYVEDAESIISERCNELIPDGSKYQYNEVKWKIQSSTFVKRSDFNLDFSKFVMENGILDLNTMKLEAYDPEFLTTVKIPIVYDPEAKCPEFINFMKSCFEKDEKSYDFEGIITVLEECGNILTANRKNFEISSMWIGDGSNGKSTLLKIIIGVIGSKNCSKVSIHSLENNRFALSQIFGKLANAYGDISNKELNSLGIFKQTISGDEMSAEKKNKDAFSFIPYAKHFFSANEMPDIKDNSDGAFRRIYVTKWENQFISGSNRIEDLDKKILEDEKSGIFNLFLHNYRILMKNGGFSYKQTIADVRETIKKEADKKREFIENCVVELYDHNISKDEFYEVLVKYFRSKSYDVPTKKKLGIHLPTYAFTDDRVRINGELVRVWKNIDWNWNDEWIKSNVRNPVGQSSDSQTKIDKV